MGWAFICQGQSMPSWKPTWNTKIDIIWPITHKKKKKSIITKNYNIEINIQKSRTIDIYVLHIHRLYRHIHIWKRQSYLLLSDRQQYRAFRQRVINGLRNIHNWMWMSKSVTFESEITVSSGMADKQWVGRPVGRSALTTSSQILDQCFWFLVSCFSFYFEGILLILTRLIVQPTPVSHHPR